MTLGALAAARLSRLRPGRLAVLIAVGAALLAIGATSGTPLGLAGVAACFGIGQLAMVLTNARLQQTMTGAARATVMSVSGVGAELAALAVFAGYGLGAIWLSAPLLIACFAVPLWTIALATARWLPGPEPAPGLELSVVRKARFPAHRSRPSTEAGAATDQAEPVSGAAPRRST
jgi:type IV secretory pathway TrbD component